MGRGTHKKRHVEVNELAPQLVGVHQGAVVREGDDHVVDGGEVGLRGLPAFGAGGAIAHMSHGELPGKGREVRVGKHLVAETEVLADEDRPAIAHRDARGFLAAMLQGLQAKVGETCHVATRRPDAEDAALLVQLIRLGRIRLPLRAGEHL